jgi:hypothetical protein
LNGKSFIFNAGVSKSSLQVCKFDVIPICHQP